MLNKVFVLILKPTSQKNKISLPAVKTKQKSHIESNKTSTPSKVLTLLKTFTLSFVSFFTKDFFLKFIRIFVESI